MLSSCIQPIRRPTPAAGAPAGHAEATTNRLLVLATNGDLFTIDPDGADKFALTSDANERHFYAQPTWSPNGERIAWAEINSSPNAVSGALRQRPNPH
jgi:hypothetical protein